MPSWLLMSTMSSRSMNRWWPSVALSQAAGWACWIGSRLDMKPTAYNEQHRIPQKILINQIARGGLRLISFDSDLAGPADGY